MKTLELIGNTPIVQLPGENIFLKLEKFNPGGSIKDRTAYSMLKQAKKDGSIGEGSVIVEPTSGNTGIGLAYIGKLLGYEVIIIMPDNMSKERQTIIASYGAKLILTPGDEGMAGAINRANELVATDKKYFMPDQFNNKANVLAHYETTAVEIMEQMNDINIFVAAYGTGGTFTGIAKRLKEYNKNILTITAQPINPKKHGLQGIGAGFMPSIMDISLADDIISIGDDEAIAATIEVSNSIGILLGISTGANIVAARRVAEKYGKDKKIITISPDGGEKYLTVVDYAKYN